jgi:hypothetical protein
MFDGEFFGDSERRSYRYRIEVPAVLCGANLPGQMDVRLLNVGGMGCRISTPARLRVGDAVTIAFGTSHTVEGVVRWSHAQAAGVEFCRLLPPGVIDKLLDW